jgi:hypothetical protein
LCFAVLWFFWGLEGTMLRRILAVCFLIALGLFFASGARADEIITWTLPASPTPSSFCTVGVCGSSAFFEIDGVPFSVNGVSQTGGMFDFYPSVAGGGFSLQNGGSVFLLNEFGGLLYMGGEGSPTFVPGTYGGFTSEGTLSNGLTGILTITSIPGGGDSFTYDLTGVTGVPEPASLLLLGTGIVGLIGFARKKILG